MNIHEIYNELQQLPRGARGLRKKELARVHRVSTDTIDRHIRAEFGKRTTFERSKSKEYYTNRKVARLVMELKAEGHKMSLSDRELSTEACLDLLYKRGYQEAGKLSVSRVNEIMREELGYRERKAFVRFEADYANQVYLIDFSRLKYHQVIGHTKDGDYILKVSGKELHYKDQDKRLRSWTCSVMDAFSRLRIVKVFAVTGETVQMGFDTLNFLFRREEDEHPMRYLFEHMHSDNGAFIKSRETQRLFRGLGVNGVRSKPYNKTGIGKIERSHRSLWQWELKQALRLGEGNTILLSEFNELMHQHTTEETEMQHPYLPGTRGGEYRKSILTQDLQTVDVDINLIAHQCFTRTVKPDLYISIDNVKYEVPQRIEGIGTIGKEVTIEYNRMGDLVAYLSELPEHPFTLKEFSPRSYFDFEHGHQRTISEELADKDYSGINRDESIDEETGEIIKIGRIKTPSAPAKIASNFTSKYLSQPDKVQIVNNRLDTYNLGYYDFEELFHDVTTQEELDDILHHLTNELKTGT